MRPKLILFCAFAFMFFLSVTTIDAQKKARLGKVCGNPNLPCKSRSNFQRYEIPFGFPDNPVIVDSEPFYAVILKSVKVKQPNSCETAIAESERLAAQKLFVNNKVFVLRCLEPGNNYYTNVANDVSFMAVYAGKTLAEAKAFLKKVQANGKFPGASVRRMQAGINGT